MNQGTTSQEISSALKVLFGTDVKVTAELLCAIKPSDLRATFRKKAMELHPDRARIQGGNEIEMAEHFKTITQAYSSLLAFFSSDDRPRQGPGNDPQAGEKHPGPETSKPGGNTGNLFWHGQIPESRLLLGQYLYYSGIITWGTLINAISWQRRQRPSFGRIATTWKFVTPDDLQAISSGRLFGEKIGGSALRLGFMTPYQRSAILGFQRWLQRPLGEYFIERGLIKPDEMQYMARKARRHNTRFRGSRT